MKIDGIVPLMSRVGLGAGAVDGASLTFEDSMLEANTNTMLIASSDGQLELHTTRIRDTHATDGWDGTSIELNAGSRLVAEDVVVLRGHASACNTLGATLEATHLWVEATQPFDGRFERGTTCAGEEVGHGLVLVDGASVSVTRFRIVDNETIGVAFHGGVLSLTEGTIAKHPVGIHVGVPDFDLDDIQTLQLLDNDRNLDRSARSARPSAPRPVSARPGAFRSASPMRPLRCARCATSNNFLRSGPAHVPRRQPETRYPRVIIGSPRICRFSLG